jgi:hypothetical protein
MVALVPLPRGMITMGDSCRGLPGASEFARGLLKVAGVVFERRCHVEKAGARRGRQHVLGRSAQFLCAAPQSFARSRKLAMPRERNPIGSVPPHRFGTGHERSATLRLPQRCCSAELLGEPVGLFDGFECRAKDDAKIEHVQHDQFVRLDTLLSQPISHLGEMGGDRQIPVAGDDDRLQSAAPRISSAARLTQRAYRRITN